jgi:hypothetical protein
MDEGRSMRIESRPSGVEPPTAAPALATQRGDGELPRVRGEPYGKYLRRLQDLTYEQMVQRREYKKYGKRWDDCGHDKARKGERAYPTYLKLRAIDAELCRRATRGR